MNDTLRIITEIDSQIAQINKILNKKEYMGAGLSIDLSVGNDKSSMISGIKFSLITGRSDELLKLALNSLNTRRQYYIASLQKQLKEINAYLTNNE